jgi:hypothetical protein
VHFFLTPGKVPVQVISHTDHHRYFPTSFERSRSLLRKEMKKKDSLRNTGFFFFFFFKFFLKMRV